MCISRIQFYQLDYTKLQLFFKKHIKGVVCCLSPNLIRIMRYNEVCWILIMIFAYAKHSLIRDE